MAAGFGSCWPSPAPSPPPPAAVVVSGGPLPNSVGAQAGGPVFPTIHCPLGPHLAPTQSRCCCCWNCCACCCWNCKCCFVSACIISAITSGATAPFPSPHPLMAAAIAISICRWSCTICSGVMAGLPNPGPAAATAGGPSCWWIQCPVLGVERPGVAYIGEGIPPGVPGSLSSGDTSWFAQFTPCGVKT